MQLIYRQFMFLEDKHHFNRLQDREEMTILRDNQQEKLLELKQDWCDLSLAQLSAKYRLHQSTIYRKFVSVFGVKGQVPFTKETSIKANLARWSK